MGKKNIKIAGIAALVVIVLIALMGLIIITQPDPSECTTASDCEGRIIPPCGGNGNWTCQESICIYECNNTSPTECESDSDCDAYADCTMGNGWGSPGECFEGKCRTGAKQTCVKACGAECKTRYDLDCPEGYECMGCMCEETGNCVEDQDCFYCNGNKSSGYSCINGECEYTDSLHCDKECGAECEEGSCPEGQYCDTTDCTCHAKFKPTTGGVSLETEKTDYGLWQTVRITLSNDLSENLCYYAPGGSQCNKHAFTVQWHFRNETWQNLTTFRKGITCSDIEEDEFCLNVPAGGEEELTWDQTFHYSRKDDPYYQAPKGTYRVTIRYKTDGEWEEVVSNEFILNY